jgi:hypothetical protein
MEQLGSQSKDFSENLYWALLLKPVKKIQFFKIGQIRHFSEDLSTFMIKLAEFFPKFLEEMKLYLSSPVYCFRKLCRLRDNYENYCRTRQVIDDVTHYGVIILVIIIIVLCSIRKIVNNNEKRDLPQVKCDHFRRVQDAKIWRRFSVKSNLYISFLVQK